MVATIEIFTRQGAKLYAISAKKDKALSNKLAFLYVALEWLELQSQIKLKADLPREIRKANLPTTLKNQRGYHYTSLIAKIDGEIAIIIHDKLKDAECLGQIFHEIMHKIFSEAPDSEIQKNAIFYLERIIHHYNEIISPKNADLFKRKEISQHEIKKEDLSKALFYLRNAYSIDAIKE